MNTAFVLGNGISRKVVDLTRLKTHGKVYGCNAIYREFTPDVLVATDRPIATAIQESGYSVKNKFYTRRPIDGFGAYKVPKEYFGYSSGPIATAIAAEDGNQLIYLLGFDMGPTETNGFNNIYAGTEFYKKPDALPTFTGNWAKQLTEIIGNYQSAEFVRVHGPTTANIELFGSLKNLKSIDLAIFCQQFN